MQPPDSTTWPIVDRHVEDFLKLFFRMRTGSGDAAQHLPRSTNQLNYGISWQDKPPIIAMMIWS
jgi:hypothetical protein